MNLKKLSLNSASVLIALLIAGCGGPQVKPTEVKKVTTLKSSVMAGYSCPGTKVKKKSILAVKAPDMLRFEIKGFFNEPFFMLTSKGNKVQAYFVQDNAYFEGEILEASSDSVASLLLNQTGKLKIKDMDITSVFTKKSDDSLAPATAEFSSGEYKLSFAFSEPEVNKEIADSIFELTPPKKAKRISIEDINRYFSKWSK
ncbi:MAG: hypothetical protein A2231_13035 [Candidatus Firestonebacteria bacterium RIFOXYA2_FULL_40_8]|nr:MAG: hypothetical protein A2231_13035 [Candidatus Firestonebacteria bacterium RIFOXYA2_FULL_40_8]